MIGGMNRRQFLAAAAGAALLPARPAAASEWSAGTATVDITPDRSLWMAGYAARTKPSDGVLLPLHAKALALRVAEQRPVVLVTADLLGVTAAMTGTVASRLGKNRGLPRANLLINASHTHCGPVVDEQLSVAYDISPEGWAASREYTASVEDRLATVAEQALARLSPARVSFARGEAGFAANRRVSFTPDGPVERSVPVLRVDRPDGALLAIVFGYACHNTTLPATIVQYHGDYAGVAQAALERRHAGATALFVAGCGADANPKPRGTLELAQAHGEALADSVDRVLSSAAPVRPELRARSGTVDLPFAADDVRARWKAGLDIQPVYLERHARLMEQAIARTGRLPAAQPDPVQVWRFGSNLTLVALGGEVVVDYALRLAREYPGERMWVAGYSNDVFGYVPSRRVLREGGYEGGDAMIYYGRPGPFSDDVEERIVGEVRKQMKG
jgi:hypothetical protein